MLHPAFPNGAEIHGYAGSINGRYKRADWLSRVRQSLETLDEAELARLPLGDRLSIAAGSMELWQERIGLTSADKDNWNRVGVIVADYITQRGDEALVKDAQLSFKAMQALPHSGIYTALLDASAERIIDAGKAYGQLTADNAGPLANAVVAAQDAVWKDAFPDVFSDLPPFKVITQPRTWRMNECKTEADGSSSMYIGPEPDGTPNWSLSQTGELAWYVGHEHHHHIIHIWNRSIWMAIWMPGIHCMKMPLSWRCGKHSVAPCFRRKYSRNRLRIANSLCWRRVCSMKPRHGSRPLSICTEKCRRV